MGYQAGQSREQIALFATSLEDAVEPDNLVRVIDAFVVGLDLVALGFTKARPAGTGRPAYDPADLLRLYVYGYMNQVRSSRRLERETKRNVETMWLLRRLSPDHKTIAQFRRENGPALQASCRHFVKFCQDQDLLKGQWIAIDGSKFEAVASRKALIREADLRKQEQALEESIARYLGMLEQADVAEEGVLGIDRAAVQSAVEQLREEQTRAQSHRQRLEQAGQTYEVQGEEQARLMRTGGGTADIAYNVQAAVDTQHLLVVHHEVTNETNDLRSLLPVARAVKEALGCDTLNVVADKGYSNAQQLGQCEQQGIIAWVPIKRTVNNSGQGKLYDRTRFAYDPSNDTYRCPANEVLVYQKSNNHLRARLYGTAACAGCAQRSNCTKSRQRIVTRSFDEAAMERSQRRVDDTPQAMQARRQSVEPVFGTLKHRVLGNARLLMRHLSGAGAEMALAVLAYNLKRVCNVMGSAQIKIKLAAG